MLLLFRLVWTLLPLWLWKEFPITVSSLTIATTRYRGSLSPPFRRSAFVPHQSTVVLAAATPPTSITEWNSESSGSSGTREDTKEEEEALLLSSTATTTPHVKTVVLVECGFGNDSHGQNATKAAIRACRNAIEFNSVSIQRIIPGGYDQMKLNVILAVPPEYMHTLDLSLVALVFPFGNVQFHVRPGGMIAPSGRVIEQLGDRNNKDDMVIVCAAVQVGY